MSPAPKLPKPVPQQIVRLGPWKGVRDVGDGEQSPEFLQDAINGFFPDAQSGAHIPARSGFARMTASALTAGAGNNQVLCIHGITVAAGTHYLFVVQDTKVYRQSGATSWTDVTPAGISIAGNVRVHAVNYDDEIIFSDGVNRPWRATNLGSTPITGTYIQVNTAADAWFARGQPTVYGGKLFFVVADIGGTKYPSRIVWSEELNASTGYLQNGYTNSWDLVQTGSDKINAILGTNAALYYWRQYSIGAVFGAVSSDFSTASTHDAVSQEIGTLSSSMPIVAKGYVWFLDADGNPHRFAVGSSQIDPIWKQLRQRIRKIKATALDANGYLIDFCYIAYSNDLNKVVILFLRDSSASGDYSRNLYVFDADTGSYEGRWMPEVATQPANEVPNSLGVDCVVSAPIATAAGDYAGTSSLVIGGVITQSGTFGHVARQYLHKQQTFGDNSAAMHQSVMTQLVPNSQTVELRATEIAVEAVPDDATLSIQYYTPRGASTALTPTGLGGADLIQSSHDKGIYRAGLNGLGRWFRWLFYWNVPSGTTQYAIDSASVKVQGYKASGVSK